MTFPGVSGPFQRGNETDLTYRLKWAAWEWLYKEAGCAFKQALADYRRLERKEVAYKLRVAAFSTKFHDPRFMGIIARSNTTSMMRSHGVSFMEGVAEFP